MLTQIKRTFLSQPRRKSYRHGHRENQRWTREKCLWKGLRKRCHLRGLTSRSGSFPWGTGCLHWKSLPSTTLLARVNTVETTTSTWRLCWPPGPELQPGPGRRRQWNGHKRLMMSGAASSPGEVSLWTFGWVPLQFHADRSISKFTHVVVVKRPQFLTTWASPIGLLITRQPASPGASEFMHETERKKEREREQRRWKPQYLL